MARAGEAMVVSGMGAVSALGLGVPALWAGLCAGRCGIGQLQRLEADRFRIRHAGEVCVLPGGRAAEAQDVATRCLIGAVEEALDDAALSEAERRSAGLVAGSNFGAMASTELLLDAAGGGGVLHEAPVRETMAVLGLAGAGTALSLSCASGNAAIGFAADLLRSGRAEVVVAAGYDAISEVVWAGLCALRAMSATALRPFDIRRDGTIFGEGAGALVLETAAHASGRGARPQARYLGCGTSSNAFHLMHPDARGEGMARAMRAALADAGVAPDEVAYINAHATGTKPNDKLESAAIREVFGAHADRLAVSGMKAMLGHAMGAAGALEAIATVMTLREGIIPQTLGLEERDPECDLDYVMSEARRIAVKIALNNSAGFGGCNATTVFAGNR